MLPDPAVLQVYSLNTQMVEVTATTESLGSSLASLQGNLDTKLDTLRSGG